MLEGCKFLYYSGQHGLHFFLTISGGEFSTSTSLNSVSRSGSIGGGSVPCSSSECDSNHDDQVSMDLDMENYQMPNQDDWLALRVHGGTRAWKFSTCFNKDSTE